MDRFKAEAENLDKENRRLEENLQKQIRAKTKETPRENRAHVEEMQKEWEEQRESYRSVKQYIFEFVYIVLNNDTSW